MKVVQLLPDLDGGGVERGTLEVAEELVKKFLEKKAAGNK